MAGLLRHPRSVSSCIAAHLNLADVSVRSERHTGQTYSHALSFVAYRGLNLIPEHFLASPVLKLFTV